MLRRLLKEPLVYFVVLGFALFGLYERVGRGDQSPAGEIVVTQGRVRSLAETFARTWRRPPTAEELEGLVQDFIREEVLYREALALGLERDDTIVRRRLRQKYEFISEDTVAAAEPSAQDLAEFLQANPDRYRIESRLSFRQVFLDPQRRGENLHEDAAGLLDALRSRSDRMELGSLGDRLMLDTAYKDVSESEIAQLFGAEFAANLATQPLEQWVGPIISGYGAHLIYVAARAPGRVPALAEVRDAVKRDWAQRRRQELLDAQYQALRARYRITIEPPASGAQANATAGARVGG
jgi:hypothetical protein